MARRFEASDGDTHKFWEIAVDGARHTVTFGRMGTKGQAKTKTFASPAAAEKDADALVRSKLAKGYREASSNLAPTSAPARQAKRTKVALKGEVQMPTAMPGGRFLALVVPKGAEVGGTLFVWDSSGKAVASFKFAKEFVGGTSQSAQGEVAFICDEVLHRFDAQGKHRQEEAKGVECAAYLKSGAAVLELESCEVQLRSASGKVTTLFEAESNLLFWPVVLKNDSFALVVRDRPSQLLVFNAAGKKTADVPLSDVSATVPLETPDGRLVIGSLNTVHLLGPGRKHVKAKLSGALCTAPLALADGTVVAATQLGTVEFVGPDGKRRASFRREPVGGGKTSQDLALLADGTVIAPSTTGTLYRLDARGQLLGALELGKPLLSLTALDDHRLVCVDERSTLHFVSATDFTKASAAPADAPDLSAEVKRLERHFAPWVLTRQCEATLSALLARVTKVERRGQSLKLTFLTDDQSFYTVDFGAPKKVGAGWPKSYQAVSALHGRICFDEGPPTGLLFGVCNAELDEEAADRFSGLCDAGQNWFVFDEKKKNKLGEPGLVLFDHGMAVEDGERFPGQDKQAFGVGGMLLRALAYRVLSANRDFRGCGWG
jgi:predicted DNA-binding WGR domain protein